MSNPFTDHPKAVGMNYFSHFFFAWVVGFRLLAGFLMCAVHSFFPFVFTTTTSKMIKDLHSKLDERPSE